MTKKKRRLPHRPYYGAGGWPFLGGYYGDRDGVDRDDLTMTTNLSDQQFGDAAQGVGDGGDGGGGGE